MYSEEQINTLKDKIAELVGGLEVLVKDGRLCNLNIAFYIEQFWQLSPND